MSQQADDFVKEALLSFGKIDTLVHELLCVEVWKENVLPLLFKQSCAANTGNLRDSNTTRVCVESTD